MEPLRAAVDALAARLGRPPRLAIGKPGLDGHSNGAEQIATRARDAGVAITYKGIRQTPAEIVDIALASGADVLGLSVLSGSHMALVDEVLDLLSKAGADIPVVLGGIIPEKDAGALKARGVAAVFTPRHFDLNLILTEILDLIAP